MALCYYTNVVPVAQLDRALDSDSKVRGSNPPGTPRRNELVTLVPIFYCIKNHSPALLPLFFAKNHARLAVAANFLQARAFSSHHRNAKNIFFMCLSQVGGNSAVMNPTEMGGIFYSFDSKKNSLPLAKDLQMRPRNTDSFVVAFCGHALRLAHDSLQGKI